MKLLAPIKNDEDIVNKKYVDSIDIGSRNIVTGTDTMTIGSTNQATWKNKQWRQRGTGTIETIDITESIVPSVNKGVKLTATSTGQIGICQDLIPLNNNNIYTLSCWVRGSSSGLTCRLQPFYASSTDTGGVKNFTLTGEWQYISYTTNKSPQNATNYSGAYIYLIPTAAGDTLEVCGIKLERGNKATDWSPAPEDTDTKVTSVHINPESETTYYPTWVTGATTGEVLINDGIRYVTAQGTDSKLGYSILSLGNDITSGTAENKYGILRLYSTGGYFGQIAQEPKTSPVHHVLPATSGTILNTGTTSFTPSLTSGTAIGTLKINNTNTTLYAPDNTAGSTNTSSKIFLIGATSQVNSSTTYSHKNVYANSDNGLYLDNGSKVNSYFISKQKYTDSITHQINFGISSNGVRGIYDTNAKKWLIYATPSDKDGDPNKVISYGALEVVTGTIDRETGTTEPIKKPYGRNRVMIEGWIDGYSGSSYQGLADSMTAVSERTIVNANSKTMAYSISTDGSITLTGYGQYRLIYYTL